MGNTNTTDVDGLDSLVMGIKMGFNMTGTRDMDQPNTIVDFYLYFQETYP